MSIESYLNIFLVTVLVLAFLIFIGYMCVTAIKEMLSNKGCND